MLREIPLLRLFEIRDVRLPDPVGDAVTWSGVIVFDNLNGSLDRDILGVLPIGPAGSDVSCYVPIPLMGATTAAVFCDRQVVVPRDAFIRRRGFVPDAIRKYLLRETWNQVPIG